MSAKGSPRQEQFQEDQGQQEENQEYNQEGEEEEQYQQQQQHQEDDEQNEFYESNSGVVNQSENNGNHQLDTEQEEDRIIREREERIAKLAENRPLPEKKDDVIQYLFERLQQAETALFDLHQIIQEEAKVSFIYLNKQEQIYKYVLQIYRKKRRYQTSQMKKQIDLIVCLKKKKAQQKIKFKKSSKKLQILLYNKRFRQKKNNRKFKTSQIMKNQNLQILKNKLPNQIDKYLSRKQILQIQKLKTSNQKKKRKSQQKIKKIKQKLHRIRGQKNQKMNFSKQSSLQQSFKMQRMLQINLIQMEIKIENHKILRFNSTINSLKINFPIQMQMHIKDTYNKLLKQQKKINTLSIADKMMMMQMQMTFGIWIIKMQEVNKIYHLTYKNQAKNELIHFLSKFEIIINKQIKKKCKNQSQFIFCKLFLIQVQIFTQIFSGIYFLLQFLRDKIIFKILKLNTINHKKNIIFSNETMQIFWIQRVKKLDKALFHLH
ncbi:transmembrane protein, putative (macronuclear) [Tetrahymena thermophila SB210]|uniref:Transmembrane protein, putative n=1 Tax=Tetrahymena thermophila (strain SB210) TaxID=312017 RepID=I7M2A5_TETTS|nr:transmembrane protein, putative [Tetrahymena thermophila SB210]EAR99632.2 transmembrane protein, putative [Tetrahymena thermophila SB210]|eukprot:XP_001019877.2 transmembrane protein, putative [Tetrahymena thermophila SB210]